MTTCFLVPDSFESTATLSYQLQGNITRGLTANPIGWPNYGNADWELEAGREMLDQAFQDFAGDDIVVFGHKDGARVINLWLQQYGQTRYDDGIALHTTKFVTIGDPCNRFGGVYYEPDRNHHKTLLTM